jgi:beta-phosphoglucomutase family hydrolase
MIDGAIFDMDGVLLDNLPFHVRAWQQIGSDLGRSLTQEQIRELFGRRNREIIRALIGPDLREKDIPRLTRRKEELYRKYVAADLRPVDGLPELLNDLKGAGVKTAVATSGNRTNVDFVLRGMRFESFFDAIVTGEEVTRSKPDPEIFHLAARRIGLPPDRCVVFEDSTAGLEAAHRAGSVCIALATTYKAEELAQPFLAMVVRDFTGLSARALRELGQRQTQP